MKIRTLFAWGIALFFLLVVGGPLVVFGLKVTMVSYSYAFGAKSPSFEREVMLRHQAKDGDASAVALIASEANLQRAVRELQVAKTDAQGISTSMLAAEVSQRRRDYSLRQVMAEFEGVSSDGKLKRQFEGGDVVRYYPLEKTLQLPNDTKLYVCVGVEPFTSGSFFWIPEEILGEEKLESPKDSRWYPANSDDPAVVKMSAITLAPGQESPVIQIVPETHLNYRVDFNHRKLLLWQFNGGDWEAIPRDIPAIKGVGRLKFKLSPYATEMETIMVSLKRR